MLNIITLLNDSCVGTTSCESAFYLEAPFLVIELILAALSNMLIYVAIYEFICAHAESKCYERNAYWFILYHIPTPGYNFYIAIFAMGAFYS